MRRAWSLRLRSGQGPAIPGMRRYDDRNRSCGGGGGIKAIVVLALFIVGLLGSRGRRVATRGRTRFVIFLSSCGAFAEGETPKGERLGEGESTCAASSPRLSPYRGEKQDFWSGPQEIHETHESHEDCPESLAGVD